MKDKAGALLQFIKFGIVGLFNTAISYVVFYIFVSLDIHYLIANVIGFIVGVLNAYYWSNWYVFKNNSLIKRNHIITLLKTFGAYGITGVVLQSILLYLFVECFFMESRIAQLLCLLITVPFNFLLNKFWSFKS